MTGGSGTGTLITTPGSTTGVKLYELLLKIAETMMDVFRSTSSAAGTTSTIIDTKNKFQDDYFKDGTIWILSGAYEGAYRVIGNNSQGTITIDATLAAATPINTPYAIAPNIFKLVQMQQAVNVVLDDSRYMLTDQTLTIQANTEEYTLPVGVTQDVRRVEIATSNSAPYGWYPHRAWEIVNGKLKFLRWVPSGTNPIRLHYVGNMGPLTELISAIPITIDINHLKWKSIAFLYKRYFDVTKGDHPEKQVLLQEANERANAAAGAAGEPYLLPRDPIMGDVRS